jgi:hypothetical protein
MQHCSKSIKVFPAKGPADGLREAVRHAVRMSNALALYQLYFLLLQRSLIEAFNLDISLHDLSSTAILIAATLGFRRNPMPY